MGKRLSEKNPFLHNAEKKKRLMISAITSSQRQEGIEISEVRAEEVYRIVFEEPPVAFFRLVQFGDDREIAFQRALTIADPTYRFDVGRRDLLRLDGGILAYWLPSEILDLIRANSSLEPYWASVRQGVATFDDARFVRWAWEVQTNRIGLDGTWAKFAKGGEFSRFYRDVDLVVAWSAEARRAMAEGGRLPDLEFGHAGLTWPSAAGLLNVRVLPPGCVFGHKGPAIIPKRLADTYLVLGVLNSSCGLYLARVYASRQELGGRWEVAVLRKVVLPHVASSIASVIKSNAQRIHDAKAEWDSGNELSTRFNQPWLANGLRERADTLSQALDAVLVREAAADSQIQASYTQLDAAVFDAYGLSPETRETVLNDLGERPLELIWPQMDGKSGEQKRMEHVWRLLSFCAKRVVEGDDDGIVPLVKCSNEPTLEERVVAELGKIVGAHRLHVLEGEVASELRKRVPGYKRADSIGDWLANAYFEHHVRLYKSRPIYWHLASSQQADPAFGVVVHYHRFGKDALRKLRGTYLRGGLDRLERELGHVRKENRPGDAVELQQKVDEVRAFDKRLQALDEGEFPIRVPWKDAAKQPKGWAPDIDDGVKLNILPLQTAGLLRIAKVVSAVSEEDE